MHNVENALAILPVHRARRRRPPSFESRRISEGRRMMGEVWFLLDDLRKMKGKTRMHIHCTDDTRAFPTSGLPVSWVSMMWRGCMDGPKTQSRQWLDPFISFAARRLFLEHRLDERGRTCISTRYVPRKTSLPKKMIGSVTIRAAGSSAGSSRVWLTRG